MSDKPLRVLVTGAAGQIGYALLYSIAKGDMFGPKQPISLVLLDIESMVTVMEGVVAELQDCALPLLRETISTADVNVGFKDVDAAILVGAMPRRQGMERKDLLKANIKIFKAQGRAINQHAKKTVKVLVVGNPANTNCFICKKYAPDIPPENFSCLTRLDQNRAQAQIAARVGKPNQAVRNTIIWGNHSSTQYPDVRHAFVQSDGKKTPVMEAVKDDNWINNEFIKTVQTRGGEIIRLRKLSSAMSAAKAVCDHMHDWTFGCTADEWVSMGVCSDGSYDIQKGLIYSFPVNIKADGTYTIVKKLKIDEFSRAKMSATEAELIEEKDAALGECED